MASRKPPRPTLTQALGPPPPDEGPSPPPGGRPEPAQATVQLNVLVPRELRQRVRWKADHQHSGVSAVVRQLLREWLSEAQDPSPDPKTRPPRLSIALDSALVAWFKSYCTLQDTTPQEMIEQFIRSRKQQFDEVLKKTPKL